MTDKLSWLLMIFQIYTVVTSAIFTADFIGWVLTVLVFAGAFVLAYFEIDEDGTA